MAPLSLWFFKRSKGEMSPFPFLWPQDQPGSVVPFTNTELVGFPIHSWSLPAIMLGITPQQDWGHSRNSYWHRCFITELHCCLVILVNIQRRRMILSFFSVPQLWWLATGTDVNECLSSPSPCSYQCHNLRGTYQCVCPPGQQRLPDGKSCVGEHLTHLVGSAE